MRTDQQLFLAVLRDTLSRGESVLFRVRGVSMLPWLREGQKVRVTPLGGRPLRRGDIVLFWRGENEPILHRVAAVREDSVDCRGDSGYGKPEHVRLEQVTGRVPLAAWQRLVFRMVHPPRKLVNRWLAPRKKS